MGIVERKSENRIIHSIDWHDVGLYHHHHHHHHHHHVVPPARISLTLSRHFSLAGLQGYIPYPHIAAVCMFGLVDLLLLGHMRGVNWSTSLMSSSLLLQQCPSCLVRLTCIVFVMGGRWPYSWCLVGACRRDLFNIARNILVLLPSRFFFSRLVSVQVVHPYSSIDTTAAWKKVRFILSDRSDFHMIESLSIAVYAFVSCVSMSFSVDETLLPSEWVSECACVCVKRIDAVCTH